MQLSNIAARIYTAFANTGTKNTIPVASQIGITAGAASYTDGFPPLTLTPVASGGVPPYGADFNGILNAITTIQKWQSGGGLFQYDATWSSTNGGYPQGAWLLKATGTGFWVNLVDNNTTNPDSSGANWVDAGIQLSSGQIAVAAGTADALTATFGSSPITLTNGLSFIVRANLANATTTPTFAPNGLTAHAIVKGNGLPLAAGDIAGAGHWLELQYDTTLTAWVLQNPANGIVTSKPGNFSGSYGYNASQALPANQIGMQLYFYGSTAGQTLTLPLRSATTIGNAFWFVNLASVPVTVASSGSDTLGISTPMQSFSYPASVVLQPGDSTCLVNDGFNWLEQQGVRAVNSPPQLLPITASVGGSALTINLASINLDFRSPALTNGATTRIASGSLSITVPSTATLGSVSGTPMRVGVAVAYNSGTPVLCVVNGTVDESALYSPTTISTGANSIGTAYSASAVSASSPMRLIGYVDVPNTTAGTYAAITQVQGYGGTLSPASLGVGQTWQSASVVSGTTYYNTTGRPIIINLVSSHGTTNSYTVCTINGFAVNGFGDLGTTGASASSWVIPAGASYVFSASSGTLNVVSAQALR